MRFHRLLPLAPLLFLASCETTGDPNQGGLFGWSQGKADVRQQVLRDTLGNIETDTAYQQGRSRALEQERAARQRELNTLR